MKRSALVFVGTATLALFVLGGCGVDLGSPATTPSSVPASTPTVVLPSPSVAPTPTAGSDPAPGVVSSPTPRPTPTTVAATAASPTPSPTSQPGQSATRVATPAPDAASAQSPTPTPTLSPSPTPTGVARATVGPVVSPTATVSVQEGVSVRRQNKWDKRGAFKACNLDANRLRQFSDLPTSVRLDSFASPPVSSPVCRLAVRGTYPPA